MNEALPKNTTVVICCAGMGTRLGIGATKALVDVCGQPLIIHQLKLLKQYDDIRIVVGYQAERLIEVVNQYRKDIMFVFNYDYKTTGVADSLRKALLGARDYIITLEGDTIMDEEDFSHFLNCPREVIAVSELTSAEPVRACVRENQVTKLSKTEGTAQWSGISKVRTDRLRSESSHVYEVLNELLPMEIVKIQMREIDTPDDYDRAVEWFCCSRTKK